jgi:hypothetical protein
MELRPDIKAVMNGVRLARRAVVMTVLSSMMIGTGIGAASVEPRGIQSSICGNFVE